MTNELYEINLEVHTLTSLKTTNDQGLLKCISCGEAVGVKDKKEINSLQLFKWSVALQRSRELDWETCSVQKVVSAKLLALIEDQAVYKFLAYTGDLKDSKAALMVGEKLASLPKTHTFGLHPHSSGSSPLI